MVHCICFDKLVAIDLVTASGGSFFCWAIGSWIDVNLFQLAHECTHNCFQKQNQTAGCLHSRPCQCLCLDIMPGGLNIMFTTMTLVRRKTSLHVDELPSCSLNSIGTFFFTEGPVYRFRCALFSPVGMPYACSCLFSNFPLNSWTGCVYI